MEPRADADWTAIVRATERRLQAWSRRCNTWQSECVGTAPSRPGSSRATDERPAASPALADLASEMYELGLALLDQAEQLRAADSPSWPRGADSPAHREHRPLRAAEAERVRLARNLHDGPAQQFARAVMQVEYLERLLAHDPAAVGAGLAELRDCLAQGVAEMRHALFELRLPAVETFGLVALLRAYLPDYGRQASLTVDADLPVEEVPLAPDRAIGVFRIVQEALTNVRKHAGASRVAVRLQRDEEGLTLVVEDDGRGFTPRPAHRGEYGLLGMHEHAELVGGWLTVEGRPGRGTRVVLRLPSVGEALPPAAAG